MYIKGYIYKFVGLLINIKQISQLYDFLIIGHGLAGAILSQELIQRGKKILVLDQPKMNKSSAVAAGLYNPVTGRKMVKTWLADELFEEIEPAYVKLERVLNAKFLNKIGIYRPFVDSGEQNDWEGKKSDASFQKYIESIARSSNKDFKLNDPNGGLHLALSGFVDIPKFLDASKKKLVELGCYKETKFLEEDLHILDSGLRYQNEFFDRCIFCNGLDAQNSNYFDWLPFKPVKGEILIGKSEKNISKIYNRGIFMVPAGDHLIKIGATYHNTFTDDQPTKEGEKELLEKMSQLSSEKFDLILSKAGIRPATKDRKPFIGKHPEYEHIYVFNGFGSKGVSLIPFFTRHFIEYLEGTSSLNEYVNIQRYASLYQSVGLI